MLRRWGANPLSGSGPCACGVSGSTWSLASLACTRRSHGCDGAAACRAANAGRIRASARPAAARSSRSSADRARPSRSRCSRRRRFRGRSCRSPCSRRRRRKCRWSRSRCSRRPPADPLPRRSRPAAADCPAQPTPRPVAAAADGRGRSQFDAWRASSGDISDVDQVQLVVQAGRWCCRAGRAGTRASRRCRELPRSCATKPPAPVCRSPGGR